MGSLICSRFIDRYVIASRFSNVGVTISEEMFSELVKLYFGGDFEIPEWLDRALEKMGVEKSGQQKLRDLVLVRNPSNLNFGRASYEITTACNYRCKHCYLGREPGKDLSIGQKKKILELIERSGSLWLQITGGEPLVSKDFAEIYSLAYSMGFLITLSTNGSLLAKPKVAKTPSLYPPYRITVSLYGATATSYEALTQTIGSFKWFLAGLEWAKKAGIRTRLNIIVTRYNEAEVNSMIGLAESFGFEYHVFPKLSPTLKGSSAPMELMAADCKVLRPDKGEGVYSECMAGKTFFHVDSLGKASICKVAREPSINLLEQGLDGLAELSRIAEQLLSLPIPCETCLQKDSCSTCPPRLRLYQRGGVIPESVCKYPHKFA